VEHQYEGSGCASWSASTCFGTPTGGRAAPGLLAWPPAARRRRFFGLLASVPRLRDHTPAPQGRRRQAPQDCRGLTFFGGGAEVRRSRLWSLKVVLDALWRRLGSRLLGWMHSGFGCMQPSTSTNHGLHRPSMCSRKPEGRVQRRPGRGANEFAEITKLRELPL
jgi:hypothetical protein